MTRTRAIRETQLKLKEALEFALEGDWVRANHRLTEPAKYRNSCSLCEYAKLVNNSCESCPVFNANNKKCNSEIGDGGDGGCSLYRMMIEPAGQETINTMTINYLSLYGWLEELI